jgi:GNAT superfamily N-acetyltransferase
MFWRLSRADFERRKGEPNKRAMKNLVGKGETVGLLVYVDGTVAGWCALSPRERYTRLSTSRVLKPLDDTPVWSIPCFFVARPFRNKGLLGELLRGAIAFARAKGARVLEAYPIIPYSASMPAAFAYTGFLRSFLKAGFREGKSWSRSRPIVRYSF